MHALSWNVESKTSPTPAYDRAAVVVVVEKRVGSSGERSTYVSIAQKRKNSASNHNLYGGKKN